MDGFMRVANAPTPGRPPTNPQQKKARPHPTALQHVNVFSR